MGCNRTQRGWFRDRSVVNDEIPAGLGGGVDMVAALETALAAVTETVFERVEIDLNVNGLAVPRICGVDGVEGVLPSLYLPHSSVHLLLEFRQVVAQSGYLAVTDAVSPDPGVDKKLLETM
jgi:hypothetical protein